MSLEADDRLATNKRAGLDVEVAIADVHVPQLRLVPDDVVDYYDAVAASLVQPSASVPFVGICLLERGTVVEIKSAQVTYADGARGRFYVRPAQHEALLEDGGVYLFAVCTSDADREVLALKVVPATVVDDVLGEDPWIDGGAGRSDYAQVAWSRIFDPEEVA
ncbi:hypothetical protein [Halomicrobium salinisoli]|uniref:hypothetical protein n=1 Tax=Halomicrobium salinisoli TaxID=2878391 RepID=UPI001CEFE54E|nr:hypothetical protein [Halomicrobium salinisoli]